MKLNKIVIKVLNMMRKGKELVNELELPRSVSGVAILLLQITSWSLLLYTFFLSRRKTSLGNLKRIIFIVMRTDQHIWGIMKNPTLVASPSLRLGTKLLY